MLVYGALASAAGHSDACKISANERQTQVLGAVKWCHRLDAA